MKGMKVFKNLTSKGFEGLRETFLKFPHYIKDFFFQKKSI